MANLPPSNILQLYVAENATCWQGHTTTGIVASRLKGSKCPANFNLSLSTIQHSGLKIPHFEGIQSKLKF